MGFLGGFGGAPKPPKNPRKFSPKFFNFFEGGEKREIFKGAFEKFSEISQIFKSAPSFFRGFSRGGHPF